MSKPILEPTKQQLDSAALYAGLMNEALVRILAIDHGTMNRTGLAAPFVVEFSYLQFRKLCELIALGCLVAQGDIVGAAGLNSTYSADKIINRLADLHPDFFPILVHADLSTVGSKHFIRQSGLTKDEMLGLYHKCDPHLHVGSLKKLLKDISRTPVRTSYPEIAAIAQKFRSLIESHTVIMLGGNTVFVTYLENPTSIHVAIAQAKGEASSGEVPT